MCHNIPSGGASRAIYDYRKALSEDGHSLDVFDCTSSNNGVLPLEAFADNLFHIPFENDVECTLRLPFLSGYVEAVRKFWKLGELKDVGRELARKVDRGGYDVAFIHHCSVSQAPFLLRYLKTPSVFYSGDPPRGLYEPPIHRDYTVERRPALLRLRDAWYAPARFIGDRMYNSRLKGVYEKNMKYVHVLMANSNYSLETFYKLHDVRAHVIHPGVDTETFKPIDLEKENIVLSVGGIEPIKGHDFVIESLSCVERQIRPELHIVGNRGYGVEKKYLMSLAEKLHVDLVFEENVCEEHLVHLYNRAKLTLCGAVMEPFGLTPVESMACGTPVVAVREGGFRESVSHGEVGYLSDRDPARFGGYVRKLLLSHEERENFSVNARQHVLRYWNVQRVREQLLDLFEFAIRKHA